jgi:predicted signal transduction protein with EAL and GGDEF domain
MFIDLDRFKNVNDMLGHGVGDQLLVQAAKPPAGLRAPGDVGGAPGRRRIRRRAARSWTRQRRGEPHRKARIIEALAQPFHLQGQQLFVSASVGIASYPDDGADAEPCSRAPTRPCTAPRTAAATTTSSTVAEMSENARSACRRKPAAPGARARRIPAALPAEARPGDAADQRLRGAAALEPSAARPGAAAEFIAILEDTGLILPVGEWVIGEVCRQLRAWSAAWPAVPPVAINLSARQLQQADLADTVERIVREAGVDPRCSNSS